MKTVLFAVAFIGYVQSAKLDHLKYLPPDSRPTNQESYDQGLNAPSGGQQFQQSPFGKSTSFGTQFPASRSFDVGTQKAAQLQGSPFFPHGRQSTFGKSLLVTQPTQGSLNGQQSFEAQNPTQEPQVTSSTFNNNQQGSTVVPQTQPQGSFGSDGYKGSGVSGSPTFDRQPQENYQPGTITQVSNQPETSKAGGIQSTGSYGPSQTQGSTYGQPTSSPTFTGNTGSGVGIPQGTSFDQKVDGGIPSTGSYGSSQTQGSTYGQPTLSPAFAGTTVPGTGIPQHTSFAQKVDGRIPSTGSYGSTQSQGSTYGQPTSSPTFAGTTGSGAGVPQSTTISQKVSEVSNARPQSTPVSFGADRPTSGNFGSSTNLQPNQPHDATEGQQQGSLSTGAFGGTSSQSGPGSRSFEASGRSFNGGFPAQSQPKYQPSPLNQIPIIRLDTKNYGDGTYSTSYETGNGIQAEEQGQTLGDNTRAQGSYSYTSPEGEKVGISYTADEDGYHPQGDHLPTPPPVPEAILKSIQYNMAHPEEENDDGSYNEPTSPGSDGRYKGPFGNSQFSGSSRQYLAPASGSGSRNQFSGRSFTSLNRENNVDTATPNALPSSPFASQSPFQASGYSSSTGVPSSPAPTSSSYSAQFNNNVGGTVVPTQQQKTFPTFGGSSNGPSASSTQTFSSGTFGQPKSFPGSPAAQPIQNVQQQNAFSRQSSFSSPTNAPTGVTSGSFFRQTPQGVPSERFDSGSNTVGSQSQKDYDSLGVDSVGASGPQETSTGQFSFRGSSSSPTNAPASQSGKSFGFSRPSASQGPSAGQFSFQSSSSNPTNAPAVQSSKSFGFLRPSASQGPSSGQLSFQGSSAPTNAPEARSSSSFSQTGPTSPQGAISGQSGFQESKTAAFNAPSGQYQGTFGGQQGSQTSYSSGVSGYQYSTPSTPFSEKNGKSLQGGFSEPKPFGNTQGSASFSRNQFGSGSGPSKVVGEFESGVSGGHAGPVRTPGVQPTDENGGYIY